MRLTKLMIIIIVSMLSIFTSNSALAANKNHNKNVLNKTLDSSDTLVGDTVKGTGNVIRATKKTVKDVGKSISNSVENND